MICEAYRCHKPVYDLDLCWLHFSKHKRGLTVNHDRSPERLIYDLGFSGGEVFEFFQAVLADVPESFTEDLDAKWRDLAECKDATPAKADQFFAGATDKRRQQYALKTCLKCVVKVDCLSFAIKARQGYGVWGGTTEHERRDLIRKLMHPEGLRELLEVTEEVA